MGYLSIRYKKSLLFLLLLSLSFIFPLFSNTIVASIRFESSRNFQNANASIIYPDAVEVNPSISTNMGINGLHEMGLNGSGVTIAILDSGINKNDTRFDIDGNSMTYDDQRIKVSKSFVNGENEFDYNGHGTMVTGLIASNDIIYSGYRMGGIAKGADIWHLKVLDKDGSGSTESIIEALDYILANKDIVDIVSMSFGAEGVHMEDVENKVIECWKAGIIVVIAAGNEGSDDYGNTVFYTINSPASALEPIAVGAAVDGEYLAVFSSNGPSPETNIYKPEVVVPGVQIVSTLSTGGLGVASGTSLSTPILAGSIALVLQGLGYKPSPDLVKAALLESCTLLGYQLPYLEGAGMPDFVRMLNLLEEEPYDGISILPSVISFPNVFDPAYEYAQRYDYPYLRATVIVGKNVSESLNIEISDEISRYIRITENPLINKIGQYIIGIDFFENAFKLTGFGTHNGTINLMEGENIVARINVYITVTYMSFIRSSFGYLILIALTITMVAIIGYKRIIRNRPKMPISNLVECSFGDNNCICDMYGDHCYLSSPNIRRKKVRMFK